MRGGGKKESQPFWVVLRSTHRALKWEKTNSKKIYGKCLYNGSLQKGREGITKVASRGGGGLAYHRKRDGYKRF